MKLHPVVAQVGYWKDSDPLLLSYVLSVCIGMEAGGEG